MFYSEVILTKRGPLAKVWLAAHWERKLSKREIVQANIPTSVDAIIDNRDPKALRLTGQLLVGVVRIYSRKAKYLLDDCNEAKLSLQMAFRPGVMELPQEQAVAAFNAITLSDNLGEFDLRLPMPDLNAANVWLEDILPSPGSTPSSQARMQDITLQDPLQTTPRRSMFAQRQFGDDLMDLDDGGLAPVPLDFGLGDDVSLEQGRNQPSDIEIGRDAATSAAGPSIGDFGLRDKTLEGSVLGEGLDTGAPQLDLFGGMDDSFAQPPPAPLDIFDPAHQGEISDLGGGGDNILFDTSDQNVEPAAANVSEAEAQQGARPKKKRIVRLADARIELSNAEMAALLKDTSSLRAPPRFMPRSLKELEIEQYLTMPLTARVALPIFENIAESLKGTLYVEPIRIGMSAHHQGAAGEGGLALLGNEEEEQQQQQQQQEEEEEEEQHGQLGHKRRREESPGRAAVEEEEPFGGAPVDVYENPFDDNMGLPFGGDELPPQEIEAAEAAEEAAAVAEEVSAAEQTRRRRRQEGVTSLIDFIDDNTQDSTAAATAGVAGIGLETDSSQAASGFSKNTEKTVQFLRQQFAEQEGQRPLRSDTLMKDATKSQAAKFFYEMLLLSTKDMLKLEQQDAFGPVVVHAKAALHAR
ncbi:sister chromatid cohesion protein 1 [Sorochytrium milnesiophthora]